jgi:hypothetical protein
MKYILLFLVLLLNVPFCYAEELTAAQIIAKSWQLYRQVSDEKETIEIVIKYNDSRREEKSLIRWIKYDSAKAEDKVTIKFFKPAIEDGLGLLTWRHSGGSDDQWLKLPSLDRVRRVSISDQAKYFAGTDITYEDSRQLIGERTSAFDYRVLRNEENLWVIEALPKAGTETGYSRRIFWIDNKFAVHKIEYYSKDGKFLKVQTNSHITYTVGGLWRAALIEINNLMLTRQTSMRIVERRLNISPPPDIFSIKFLESRRTH